MAARHEMLFVSPDYRATTSWMGPAAEADLVQKLPDDYRWLRGANYVPSYARNDVQTWMDFDPAVVDRELGYAAGLHLNCVRVFLQVAIFEQNKPLQLRHHGDDIEILVREAPRFPATRDTGGRD